MSTTNCLMAEVRLVREMDRLWFRLEKGIVDPESADAYLDAKTQIERRLAALDAVVERWEREAA